MKGFEWLREVPDLNVPITDEHDERFPGMDGPMRATLAESVAYFAVVDDDNSMLLRYVIDRDFNVRSEFAEELLLISTEECARILIDAGIPNTDNSQWTDSDNFIQSRNRARSSAILVMHAMCEMDKTYKNVSVIIGRAIWESRGDCENWLKK